MGPDDDPDDGEDADPDDGEDADEDDDAEEDNSATAASCFGFAKPFSTCWAPLIV